jgi:hypothetical protein
MSNTDTVFTPDQLDKLMKTVQEMMNSKFLDPSNPPTRKEQIDSLIKGRGESLKHYKPDAFDVSKPEVMYREVWQLYLSSAGIHDRPSNKKGTRRFNTTKRRSSAAQKLAKYLGGTPTAADLKAAFPTLTQLDDDLCKAIDMDLENLTR